MKPIELIELPFPLRSLLRSVQSVRDIHIDLTTRLKCIQRTLYAHPAFIENMRVDHRCLDILVTQQFLNGSDVITTLQKVSCEAVSEGMWADRLGEARMASCLLNGPLQA